MAEPAPLYYFQGHGRAERVRWVLAAADVPFENEPVTTRAQFLELCESGVAPLRQLPVLRTGGRLIVQTPAMVDWAARQGGLGGSTPDEELEVRALVELSRDFSDIAVRFPFLDREQLAELREKLLPAQIRKFLPIFESAARANARGRSVFNDPATHSEGEGGAVQSDLSHLVGGSLTAADVCLAQAVDMVGLAMDDLDHAFLGPYPLTRSVVTTTLRHPPLQAYLQSSRRYPRPDHVYARNVDEVLGRA